MSEITVHEFEARDLEITKLVIFNDRAEVKRNLKVSLKSGLNEVQLKNNTNSLVDDSLRIEGRGNAIIHDVTIKTKPALKEESDSPKVAKLRENLKVVESQQKSIQDKLHISKKRLEALDVLIKKIGERDSSNGAIVFDETSQNSIENILDFHERNSEKTLKNLRELEAQLEECNAKVEKAREELNQSKMELMNDNYARYAYIILEAKEDCEAELDITYQTFNAGWCPTYDIRVDTENAKMSISYYGKVFQNSGEDWNNVSLLLSTAQPHLGGHIPELGTLDAVFYRPPPPQPRMFRSVQPTAKMALFGAAQANAVEESAVCDAMPIAVASNIVKNVLSSEFKIVRQCSLPHGTTDQKLTIGIVEMSPKFCYECVPSKNPATFLTAVVVNSSELLFLNGEASIYLNNAFVAKTFLKNVSPGERFTCSLGVDPSIRVQYKPAKKFHQEGGLINKHSVVLTEQVINIKNTRSEKPVIITVKHHVPRSTEETIRVKLVNPTVQPYDPNTENNSDNAEPEIGAKMNANNNLEWTEKIEAGGEKDLVIKWTMEHPKSEKIEFVEKY